jgi:LPS-assembly lipoprotein
MLLFDPVDRMWNRICLPGILLAAVIVLAGCVYRPLYGSVAADGGADDVLSQIWVEEVDTRTAQQLRNHLIFLLQGGRDNHNARYLAKLRVVDSSREFAAVKNLRYDTAGSVTINVSYDLIDTSGNVRVAGGSRVATASFDRTGQSFANSRALRDAQNRAAKEAAEKLRLAFAADLRR